MKKRILSLFMALALCLSMTPTVSYAEETGAVTEQEAKSGESTADVYTTGNETNDNEAPGNDTTGNDVSGNDVSGGNAEQDAAVRAAQKLIDALPEEVTAENTETIGEQLAAIDEAMDKLTAEQFARLDRTRLEKIYSALNAPALVAVQDGGHSHPICGTECTHKDASGNAEHSVESSWTALSYDGSKLTIGGTEWKKTDDTRFYVLEEGNYYLENNLTLGGVRIRTSGKVNLCLNGHSITQDTENSAIVVETGSTFSLCDCKSTGSNGILHIEASKGFYGITIDGTFNMYGGVISGSSNRGGVSVSNSGSTFNMYGGEISGNAWGVDVKGSSYGSGSTFNMYGGEISGNEGGEYGGGVVVEQNATFNMSGGKITKNSARNGGGVHVGENATFNMTGGEITNNTATVKVGGVYVYGNYSAFTVSGAPKITGNTLNKTENNVYLPSSNKTITIGKGGLNGDAKIGVTVATPPTTKASPVPFATAETGVTLSRTDAKAFLVDNNTNKTYSVQLLDDNKLYVYYGDLHRHSICGDASCTDSSHKVDVDWTGVSELTKDMEKGYYYLTADVTLNTQWTPEDGIVLCLNGHSITAKTEFTAIGIYGRTFTLTDCNGSDGEHYFKNDTKDRWVPCEKGDTGSFLVEGGVITRVAAYNSGGVLVENGGTFIMYGGTICGHGGRAGAGVCANYSKFTMYGGAIKGNSNVDVNYGGGVCVFGSTFTMTGGTISGNKSKSGGGVYMKNSGVLTIEGGVISGNNATETGGGVYANVNGEGNIFTVSGEAQITGNWTNGTFDSNAKRYVDGEANNVYLAGSGSNVAPITIGEGLKQNAKIGISMGSLPAAGNNVKIATGATSNELNYAEIFPLDMDDQSYSVIRDGKELYICLHQHSWGYEVSGSATIKAICKAKDCPNTNGGSVTIKAPDELTYDGNAKTATLAGAFTNGESNPEISYKAENGASSLEAAPTDAGSYTASITVGGVIASVSYKIERATLTISDFTFNRPTDLVYSGKGKTATVESAKIDENYISRKYYDENSDEVVEPKNVGHYTVKIDVKESQNYKAASELMEDGWSFNITPATITVTPKADQSKTYGDADPVLAYTSSGAVNDETPAFTGALSRAKGTDAGDYAINKGTLTLADGEGFKADNYELQFSSTEVNFTIKRRPVTVTGITANDKIYDGTTSVTFDCKNANFEGKLSGDNLTVRVFGTFGDKNVGEDKKVKYAGMILGGESASNYVFGEGGQTTSTANITPKELTIKDVTVANKTYDGTTEAKVTGVTFEGFVNGESSVDYTVSGKFEDAAVGTGKCVTATVMLKEGSNYTLSKDEYIKTGCEISKATAPTPKVAELVIINKASKGYTFALSGSLPTLKASETYGKCTYQEPAITIVNPDYAGTAAVSKEGMLTLNITKTGAATDVIGTVTVVVQTENYEDITLTVNIKATDKIIPTLEKGTLAPSSEEITYGDKLDTITISGTMKDGDKEVPGTFAWVNGEITPAVGNGTYTATWKFTPKDTENYEEVTGTVEITVKKAGQSGTVSMGGYTYNDTPATPTLSDEKGDGNAKVTYYYSTTDTNKGGTEWKNIGKTTLNAGTYYMYAVIGETANYNAFTTQAVKFVVGQATPVYTKPTGVTAKYGQKLSEITLVNPADGEWSWQTPDNVFDTIGVSRQYATFKPTSPNYKEVSNIAIEVTVGKADGRDLGTVELEQAFNDSGDHTYTPDWSKLPAGQTWSYGYESSDSNNFTKLEASAENVTYAVSGGKVGDKLTVTLKASCDNYEDFTITLNITITKAAPTGEPGYTRITTGDKTLADAKLAVGTLSPAEGELEWIDADGKVLSDDTKVEVNTTYTWRFTPTDSDNYKVLTGGIELYHVDMPTIRSQPKDASVKAGERAVFEVTATGTDLTYQWKINRNDGKGFVNISGADGASYTSGVTDTDCNGFQYYCVISNAAGSVTTGTVTLTVTVQYEILDGADSSWTENTDGSLIIRGSGAIDKFLKVMVDGKVVDRENYTVKEGSTIITFKPEFLKTLSEGSHSFEIVWTDGTADTHFTVARNSSGNNGGNNNNDNNNNSNNESSNNNADSGVNTTDTTIKAPKTGDASDDALWVVLLVVACITGLAGAAEILVIRRRNDFK